MKKGKKTGSKLAEKKACKNCGMKIGVDMGMDKDRQAVEMKVEPRFVLLKSDKHFGIYDQMKGMVDVSPVNNSFNGVLAPRVVEALNDIPELSITIKTWEPISKYADEFLAKAPASADMDPNMPKAYKSLTEENGRAATEKIVAALKDEFGPDVSVIISLAQRGTDGKLPTMNHIDANGSHIRVTALKLVEMAQGK